MKTKLDLLSDREHAARSADDIVHKAQVAGRPLTAEERQKVEEHLADIATLDKQIDELEDTERVGKKVADALERGRTATQRAVSAMDSTNGDAKTDADRVPIRVRPRYRSLRAFKGPDAEERAYEAGQWCRAVIFNDEAARRWCLNRGLNFRAMKEGDNLYGGSLVPDQFSQTIIDLRESYGVFRQEARVVPMSTDHMLVPRCTAGVSASFYGEGSAISDTQSSWDNIALTPQKLGVLVKLSTELAEDAVIDLAEWVATDIAKAFAYKEDYCGFNGDGTTTYGGMIGLTTTSKLDNTSLAGGVEATATIDKFSEITAADLSMLMGALPAYAHPGAKWFCSQACADIVFGRLAYAAGGTTFTEMTGGRPFRSFMGYPIVVSQVLPTSTGSLDTYVMLLFGDLSLSSMFGDRRGITLAVLRERYAEYDQIGVIATERFHINNHDIGNTTTAGPIVGYIGNVA